jgi:hypothetical protein
VTLVDPYPVGPIPTIVEPYPVEVPTVTITEPYPVDPVTVTMADPYPVDPVTVTMSDPYPDDAPPPDPVVINVPDANFEDWCWNLNVDTRDLPDNCTQYCQATDFQPDFCQE